MKVPGMRIWGAGFDTRWTHGRWGWGWALAVLLVGMGCRRDEVPSAESPPIRTPPGATTVAPARREPPLLDLTGQDEAIVLAVESATERVRQHAGDADAWGHLGMVLLVHGFHPPAGQCLAEAAERDPTEARWPYYLYFLERETNRVAALVHLKLAAARLNPRTMPPAARRGVRQRLAEALIEDGQGEAALAVLTDEPEDIRPDPGHQLLRARCHWQVGRWDRARECAESAAEGPEARGDALRLLAQLDQRRGDSSGARARLAEAAPLPPWRRVDPLAEALEREARGLRAALQTANQWLNAGRFTEVRKLLNQTVLTYPGSAYAWLILGKAELAAARWKRAENCFRRAVENDPGMVEAHFQLGQSLRGQQRLDEAVACFRRGTGIKRDSVPAQYMLGLTLMELGQPAEALPAFRVCLECRPQYAESHLRLAQALSRTGQGAEAQAHLEAARRLTPLDAVASQILQEVEAELDRR